MDFPYRNVSMHVLMDGILYFAGQDVDSGDVEVWRTDGTAAGTRRIEDLIPGLKGSRPRDFVAYKGRVYFTALDTNSARELYSTDGATIRRETEIGSDPSDLAVAAGALFFAAEDLQKGREPFRLIR